MVRPTSVHGYKIQIYLLKALASCRTSDCARSANIPRENGSVCAQRYLLAVTCQSYAFKNASTYSLKTAVQQICSSRNVSSASIDRL